MSDILIEDDNIHTYSNKNRTDAEYFNTFDEFTKLYPKPIDVKYQSRINMDKSSPKIGQLKLLIAEIEFMNICIQRIDDLKLPILFLYVGAAPGTHTSMLIELYSTYFRDITWVLVDPTKFDKKLNKYSNVILINDFFTDNSPQIIKSKYPNHIILYNCDMRGNIKVSNKIKDESESIIWDEMQSQLRWHYQLKPLMTMLKIHFPYVNKESVITSGEYIDGPLYFQAFAGKTSSEMRMILDGSKTYSNKIFDFVNIQDNMYYFNTHYRNCLYKKGDKLDTFKFPGLDNCYDCTKLIRTLTNYITLTNKIHNKNILKKLLKKVYSHCNLYTKSVALKIDNKFYSYPFTSYTDGKVKITFVTTLDNIINKKKYIE